MRRDEAVEGLTRFAQLAVGHERLLERAVEIEIDRQVIKYKTKIQNHANEPVKRQQAPAE